MGAWVVVVSPAVAGARQDGGRAACIDGMRSAGEATVKLQKPYHRVAGDGEHIALVAAGW